MDTSASMVDYEMDFLNFALVSETGTAKGFEDFKVSHSASISLEAISDNSASVTKFV
jgi:hypothetical protein